MKNIGYVVEIERNRVLIATTDYNYILIKPKPNMVIGQLILFEEFDIIKEPAFRFSINKKVIAVAAVIIVSLFLSNIIKETYIEDKSVYAFVEFSGNDKIEMSVSKDYTILETGYNLDKENKSALNLSMETYIVNNLEKIINNKLITSANDSIIITLSPHSSKANEQYMKSLRNIILESLKNLDINEKYYINDLTKEDRLIAKSKQLDMAQMKLYKLAEDKVIDLPINELKKENANNLFDSYIDRKNPVNDIYVKPLGTETSTTAPIPTNEPTHMPKVNSYYNNRHNQDISKANNKFPQYNKYKNGQKDRVKPITPNTTIPPHHQFYPMHTSQPSTNTKN